MALTSLALQSRSPRVRTGGVAAAANAERRRGSSVTPGSRKLDAAFGRLRISGIKADRRRQLPRRRSWLRGLPGRPRPARPGRTTYKSQDHARRTFLVASTRSPRSHDGRLLRLGVVTTSPPGAGTAHRRTTHPSPRGEQERFMVSPMAVNLPARNPAGHKARRPAGFNPSSDGWVAGAASEPGGIPEASADERSGDGEPTGRIRRADPGAWTSISSPVCT